MREDWDKIGEQLLVLRSQSGDPTAFADLVDRFSPRLRYFLCKLLGDQDAVDDALQEVWLDVFQGLPRLAAPGAFRAWLFRIAHDRACRTLRKRPPDVPLSDESQLAGCPDEPTFYPDEAILIHAALDRLTPEHREVLVLRFLEDLSYEEIAGVVGCPLGTVRSRLHHARKTLRTLLDKETHS
jgi:RNA polymerase sigma-70 factor, ECF subfamily